ncbi:DUF3263 domain-containing protein [Staphylococcus chromogenes]|nr:DUF3263 domain-containing protein [Staphylococcus chromogenes]
MQLTDEDRALLTFESNAPRNIGMKEENIREQFGISPMRYYHRLNQLIDTPAASAEFPQLVSRLRRLRDQRADELKP